MGRKISRVDEIALECRRLQSGMNTLSLHMNKMDQDFSRRLEKLEKAPALSTTSGAVWRYDASSGHVTRVKLEPGVRVQFLLNRRGIPTGSIGVVIPRPHGYPEQGSIGPLVWVMYANRHAGTVIAGHYASSLEVLP